MPRPIPAIFDLDDVVWIIARISHTERSRLELTPIDTIENAAHWTSRYTADMPVERPEGMPLDVFVALMWMRHGDGTEFALDPTVWGKPGTVVGVLRGYEDE